MVKSDSLLTNQPCECTLTAVGPVKVLVLRGARQHLADYRAGWEEVDPFITEPSTAPIYCINHIVNEAGREFRELSTAPLPPGWEQSVAPASGRIFFINHNECTTCWDDPRTRRMTAGCDAPPDPATVQLRKRRPLARVPQ